MMTLMEVKCARDPKRAFAVWLTQNRTRIARAAISIWVRFHRREPTHDELDDLVQESAVSAWEAIAGYAWICPLCRAQARSEAAFARHAGKCRAGQWEWGVRARAKHERLALAAWDREHAGRGPTLERLRGPSARELQARVEAVAAAAWAALDRSQPVASIEDRVFYQQGGAAQRHSRLSAYGGDIMRRRGMIRDDVDDVLRPQRTQAHEGLESETRAAAYARAARRGRPAI